MKDSISQRNDFESYKRQFNLFKDEKEVWRCEGRLSNADVSYAVNNPILLPRDHPVTTLIVREAHERVFHNETKETLTEVRRKYWIPRVRSLTRQLIHHCFLCKKFEGTPFKTPPPPPLPTCRVKEDPAFTHTGVDRRLSKGQSSSVSIGDVVIVHDEHLPRGLWRLGKITSVRKGQDGQVRGATVKIANSDGQKVLLNRPIQLLYPLEVRASEPVSEVNPYTNDVHNVPSQ